MLVMERGLMGMTFGQAVRRRREELGLSQSEVADRLGIEATRVSKIETGHTFRRMPDPEYFLQWADALEVDPVVLLAQMGYARGIRLVDSTRSPEMVFTSVADEIRGAEQMPPEVQQTALEGLTHARRLYDALQGKRGT